MQACIVSSVRIFCIALAACSLFVTSCGNKRPLVEGKSNIEVQIPAFSSGTIPSMYTCDGSDVSPAISWSLGPYQRITYALTVVDTDTPIGFTHWVVYNMGAHELPQNLPKQVTLPDGIHQGMTDFDKIGFGGPCPPGGSPHHYVFTVYALDIVMKLPENPTRDQLESTMKGHILSYGQFTARYQRHQN
jgi:Raf kinase inhibitor-like YbhB/YbcL family protein